MELSPRTSHPDPSPQPFFTKQSNLIQKPATAKPATAIISAKMLGSGVKVAQRLTGSRIPGESVHQKERNASAEARLYTSDALQERDWVFELMSRKKECHYDDSPIST